MLDFPTLYRKIGQRIRETREPTMTQNELARILKLERTSVSNIEKGRQKLTLEAVYLFCDRFGIEVKDLLPTLEEIRTQAQPTVVVAGQPQSVGPMTADAVERYRRSKRKRVQQ